MFSCVLTISLHQEVAGSVVVLDTVPMVNYFTFAQLPAELLFRNNPMLTY
jgi:hypothetical protein